jgi:glycopeptide antibiotics resistance protein
MCVVSVAFETVQYVLSIGFTDITDVMTNTLGGVLGLVLYRSARRFVADPKLDADVTVAGTVLLLAVVLYRLLFLKFR